MISIEKFYAFFLSKEKYYYTRDALKAGRSVRCQDDIPAEESSLKNQPGK